MVADTAYASRDVINESDGEYSYRVFKYSVCFTPFNSQCYLDHLTRSLMFNTDQVAI